MSQRPLIRRSGAIACCILALASARAQNEPRLPTWPEMMARGIVPYRQLTAADFPIDDQTQSKLPFHIRTAIEPRYHLLVQAEQNGSVSVTIDQWAVFSGFHKNDTSRKSEMKDMKAELPYAQALLDMNEIYARKLGALRTSELPRGRGSNFDEAKVDLEWNLNDFLSAKTQLLTVEAEAFGKATNLGANKKKVREMATAIRKRLDGIRATTVPLP